MGDNEGRPPGIPGDETPDRGGTPDPSTQPPAGPQWGSSAGGEPGTPAGWPGGSLPPSTGPTSTPPPGGDVGGGWTVPPPPPPGIPPSGRIRFERGRPVPMRPMGVGETLDAGISLYRAHWRTLMAVVAFVVVPVALLSALVGQAAARETPFLLDPQTGETTIDGGAATRFFFSLGAVALLWVLVVQPFLTAAMVRAVAGAYMGEVPQVAAVYRFALSRLASVLWVIVLTFLGIAGVVIAATLIGVALATAGIVPLAIIAFLGAIAGVAYLLIRWLFGPTVLVVEGVRGAKALGRSERLSRGHFWRVLGTVLLANVLAAVVGGVIGVIPGLLAESAGDAGFFLSAAGDAASRIVTTPFTTIVTVLLYFDLRIRKEGLDLAIMAQEMARPGP